MRKCSTLKLVLPALLTLIVFMQEVNAMAETQPLEGRRQGKLKIAAFTASGDLDRLDTGLNEGLDTGLTEADMRGFITVLKTDIGHDQAPAAEKLLGTVLENRQK